MKNGEKYTAHGFKTHTMRLFGIHKTGNDFVEATDITSGIIASSTKTYFL